MANKINIKLKFKNYQFSRVKVATNTGITYTNMDWVDKTVCVIPMTMDITDRYIEKCFNEETELYELEVASDQILKKIVKKGSNVGRIYLPITFVGLDVLIIEPPIIENLY